MSAPVLVTGGAGFLGHHLVRQLADEGVQVRVLDPAARATRLPGGVEVHAGSILDREALARAMEGVEVVYHLAARASLWSPDPALYERVNHQGTRAVLEAVAAAGVRRLVVTSTALVLKDWRDGGSEAVTEAEPRPPLAAMPGPYSRSKWRAEAAVLEAIADGLDAVLLYPTVPVGPPGGFLTDPTEMLKRFLLSPPPAYLETRLDLVDAADVATAHRLAARVAPAGGRYILCGEHLAFSELLRLLERLSGRPMPRRRIPYGVAAATAHAAEALARISGRPPAATVEGVRVARSPRPFSSGAARRGLGWQPRPLADTLSETVRAILARG
ncbi:MAG: NAD-dependent epimerase/dehydratase family protein [Alphaproteobacteria bacterium]|nr:MAG: NAD-dependent epimerase/dehydratase family protein [Alphaproteobacteria bacterium]